MDKNYPVQAFEEKYRQKWHKNQEFRATFGPSTEYFSLVLPPPNANGDLHVGHVMYVYEDIMVRYQKKLGKNVLWLPGRDHAGIETQYVYEKYLSKQGKSRFDFTRSELFDQIAQFVSQNSSNMKNQLQTLGFALDYEKEKYTMDPDIVKIVKSTFAKLFAQGLVYRANRLVNYCIKDGTAFSDLEVIDEEKSSDLYYLKYFLEEKKDEYLNVATTRPETIYADMALMVNPADKRYKEYIGKRVKIPLIDRLIPVIADKAVKTDFASGVVKVTPSHDRTDAEVAQRHGLAQKQIIGLDGKYFDTQYVDGLRTKAARERTLQLLKEKNLLEKTTPHLGIKKVCYKCKGELETLPLKQWYIKTKPLAQKAVAAIKNQEIKIFPFRFTKAAIRWLDNIIDWNISRQIVWGIGIPAYRCQNEDDEDKAWFVEIENSLPHCLVCGKCTPSADTDTFDTWFSSGQWPFATLQSLQDKFPDIMQYFPLSVMETGSEILYFWVCRMIMLSIFVTGQVPFRQVFLHGTVRDKMGQKMSKSKGNVVNPLEFVNKYGADALRASLLFGIKDGNDVNVSEEKVKSMRNFANKIWNIARFLQQSQIENIQNHKKSSQQIAKIESKFQTELEQLQSKYHKNMTNLKFNKNFDLLYNFIWKRVADVYIEQLKDVFKSPDKTSLTNFRVHFMLILDLLEPYMPFIACVVRDELKQS